MAIHKFTRGIVDGEAIPFFGDGESRRDYTYIDDIISGVTAAMARRSGYEIYNLGGSATTSLRELVSGLEQALGRTAKLDRQPDQPGDVPITYADVGKAERQLGYRCTTPVREGLRKFCDWYLRERQAGRVR
jgi:UDP-glucuronate 4-epimerase